MRGFLNVGVLLIVSFYFLPVLTYMIMHVTSHVMATSGSTAPVKLPFCELITTFRYYLKGSPGTYFILSFYNSIQIPQLIDIATPDSAKTRTGFDGEA